jgi:peroxiredoxin (alkyl hydroperoxide reductase subunit C)
MDLPRIREPAPSFKEKAVLDNKVFDLSLSDFKGKYVILLFYPMDL